MPKMKTHKGLAKVTKVRPGGTVKIGKAGGRHKTGKQNADFNRKIRKGSLLSKSDMKRVKEILQK